MHCNDEEHHRNLHESSHSHDFTKINVGFFYYEVVECHSQSRSEGHQTSQGKSDPFLPSFSTSLFFSQIVSFNFVRKKQLYIRLSSASFLLLEGGTKISSMIGIMSSSSSKPPRLSLSLEIEVLTLGVLLELIVVVILAFRVKQVLFAHLQSVYCPVYLSKMRVH